LSRLSSSRSKPSLVLPRPVWIWPEYLPLVFASTASAALSRPREILSPCWSTALVAPLRILSRKPMSPSYPPSATQRDRTPPRRGPARRAGRTLGDCPRALRLPAPGGHRRGPDRGRQVRPGRRPCGAPGRRGGQRRLHAALPRHGHRHGEAVAAAAT